MKQPLLERPGVVVALIAGQALCSAVFVIDVVQDARGAAAGPLALYLRIETAAAIALIAAIAFEVRVLSRLLQRKAHLERQMTLAARAFHDVIEARFDAWALTAAERDVGHFTVKGLSITEIAELRHSATGTVKSQLNAIYRKAGVGNRGELLSLLIEDLIDPETSAP